MVKVINFPSFGSQFEAAKQTEPAPKALQLILKKKWFDMIISGEKKEEYREIKKHWIAQLCTNLGRHVIVGGDIINNHTGQNYNLKKFERVIFRNGYAQDAPTIEVKCLGIEIGKPISGLSEEGWLDGDVFVIKLGEIIRGKNCTAQQIQQLSKTYPRILIK